MKTRVITRAQKRKIAKFKKIWQKVNSALEHKPKNSRDPITLEPISNVDKRFRLVSKSGHLYIFDAPSLLDYMKKSGKLLNPITRDEIDQIETTRLKRICGFQGQIFSTGTDGGPPVDDIQGDEVFEIILTDVGDIVTNLIDACEHSCEWPLELSQISQIRFLFITYVHNGTGTSIEDNIRHAKRQFIECFDPIKVIIRQNNVYFDMDLLSRVHDLCVLTIEGLASIFQGDARI